MLSGAALTDLLAARAVDTSLLGDPIDIGGGSVEHLGVPAADAVDLWRTLRRALPLSGRAPIVVAGVSPRELHEALGRAAAERNDILALAREFDAERWLRERYPDDEGEDFSPEDDLDDLADLAEEFGIDVEFLPQIESGGAASFSLPYEVLTGRPLPRVEILLLPSSRSWEAPAFLGFGGWNECPAPLEQVATLSLWQRRFGAEVFGLGSDMLELAVARPPGDEAGSRALARQQYHFCPDLVDQGFLTLGRLARAVQEAESWSFWWD